MKDLFAKALLAYIEMLEIHINTKTSDEPFHRKTGEFYEELFEIAHTIGERFVDLGDQLRSDSCDEQHSRVLEILVSLKEELESFEAPTKGVDNLISEELDELEGMIGAASGFIKGMSNGMGKGIKETKVEVEIKPTSKDETLTDEVELLM